MERFLRERVPLPASPRKELAARLRAVQEELGAGAASAALASRLASPRAFLVCTGQQPGFFGGPLLCLYKAVTTLALCRWLRHQIPAHDFIPAFWIALDDHDLDEVNAFFSLNEHLDPRRWRAELPAGRTPLGRIRVGPEILALAREVHQELPETEFRERVWERAAPRSGEPIARWFVRSLRVALAGETILFVDPDRIRDFLLPTMAAAVERSRALRDALARGASRLRAMGRTPPLPSDTGASDIFRVTGGKRERLHHVPGGFAGETTRRTFATSMLLQELRDHPGVLSPDAALRPMLQDAALPVACVVAGPHEAWYLDQIREAREVLEVPAPPLWPRLGATLIAPRYHETLLSAGLDPGACFLPEDAFRRWVEPSLPEGTREAFERIRGESVAATDALESLALEIDSTLRGPVASYRRRLLRGSEDLESRFRAALSRRAEVSRRQWRRLRGWLAPGGKLQERVFGPLPFLVRHGPELFEDLATRIDVNDYRHQLLILP